MSNQSENSIAEPTLSQIESSQSTRRAAWLRSLSLLLLIAVIGGLAAFSFSPRVSSLDSAKRNVIRANWKEARSEILNHLKQFPDDAEAHLLMAELIVKSNAIAPVESAKTASEHLQKIAGSDPLAAKARLQEARLSLLILEQPAKAERLLRESISLAPDSFEANFLMWKLLDLTGRHVVSDPYFWKCYELSPESERPERLHEWFLSEFYPEIANDSFYAAFQIDSIGKVPASINLLARFREQEPTASFVYAALARFYLDNGKLPSSLEILKEYPDLSKAMQDQFYVSVLFETLVEFGELEKARSCFDQFPEPRSGFTFCRCEGIFFQQVVGDSKAAATSFEKALATWPAKFDWGMMMKLAECYRVSGRNEESTELMARVKQITSTVLTTERTSRLRTELQDLSNPHAASEAASLYRELGLVQEANAWEIIRERFENSGISQGVRSIEK